MHLNGFIKLRISGQDLDLKEITQKLSMPPSHSYKKGDLVTSKITGKTTVHKEDSWIISAEIDKKDSVEKSILQTYPIIKGGSKSENFRRNIRQKHKQFGVAI